METITPKYLLFDHGGVLDGSLTDQIPRPDDLLLFTVDEGLYKVLKDGVQIVKLINILATKHGYKIGFHSKYQEAEQLRVLQALNEECARKKLEFPRVSAMVVRDSGSFRGIQPHSPAIIKDLRHGIWIAGYDIEYGGKACLRLALAKLLDIHENERMRHVIFDDDEKVIECAKREGWTAFLINERLSLLDALKQVVDKEEKFPDSLSEDEKESGWVDLDRLKSISRPSNLQQGIESLVPRNFTLISPPWQESIVRRDSEFKNTNKDRLGGSSLSSGIFIDTSWKEWIGKTDTNDEKLSEAWACKDRIAADIYAYYGVSTPRIEMSRQRFANNDCMQDDYGIHTMSELLPGFKTYQQAYGEDFKGKQPNPNRYLRCANGRALPERGLGHILAVASLINDVDVIGESGGNIGFQEERDQNSQLLYAKTIKIDPGEAFNPDLSLQVARSIRFALPEEKKGDSQLPFDSLPLGTQQEFLMTLHEIIKTTEAIFRGFFARQGAHAFILYFDTNVEDLTKLLISRKNKLLEEFRQDLEQTKPLFESWIEKSKMGLSPEDRRRIKEGNAIQEQYDEIVEILKGFQDLETQEPELNIYSKTFYWTTINLFGAYRSLSTNLVQDNLQNDTSSNAEKLLASGAEKMVSYGVKLAKGIPFVDGVIGALDKIVGTLSNASKENEFANRINAINKVIQNKLGLEDDISLSIGKLALLMTKAREQAILFPDTITTTKYQEALAFLNKKIDQIKGLILSTIELNDSNSTGATLALSDTALLISYMAKNSENIIKNPVSLEDQLAKIMKYNVLDEMLKDLDVQSSQDSKESNIVESNNKQFEEGRKKLQEMLDKQTFNGQTDKKTLSAYYNGFVQTFVEVYLTSQLIESGKIVTVLKKEPTVGVLSTLILFMPLSNFEISEDIETLDLLMIKLMKDQEMVSCAKRVKVLASDSKALGVLVSEWCLEILNNQPKQKRIISTTQKREDKEESFILFEQTAKAKFSDKLENELSSLVRSKLYNKAYQTSASKQGHFDALKLIRSLLSQNKDQSESIESTKQRFINEIIQNAQEFGTGNESSCLFRRDCCQLF